MADNSNEAAKTRGPGRPFKPGKSGNPGGKPKKLEELAAKCRAFDDQLIERLKGIALKGEDKDSVAAVKLLWSYGHGLPRQVVTDADGKSVPIGIMVLPAETIE